MTENTQQTERKLRRWTAAEPGGSHKQGFDQPERPHEQWHTDIA
jgi:hypothetical protein